MVTFVTSLTALKLVTMVNTEDFIKRLEYLLEYHNLSASSFADKIGVQRSSISHLLSGRNKPSLDFIMKIMEEFPVVDLYWLLEGKGTFLKSNNDQPGHEKNISSEIRNKSEKPEDKKTAAAALIDLPLPLLPDHSLGQNSTIFKIVIFYNDGTFKDFIPSPIPPHKNSDE